LRLQHEAGGFDLRANQRSVYAVQVSRRGSAGALARMMVDHQVHAAGRESLEDGPVHRRAIVAEVNRVVVELHDPDLVGALRQFECVQVLRAVFDVVARIGRGVGRERFACPSA
jgi:hypothetical protein